MPNMTREYQSRRKRKPVTRAQDRGRGGTQGALEELDVERSRIVAKQLGRAQLKNERQLWAVVNIRQLEPVAAAPRDHVNSARSPLTRCHQACVRVTDSMSSSASSSTVRFLRFTTRRKFVNAYSVPTNHQEAGNAGEEDHNTCSHGSGNVASVFIEGFQFTPAARSVTRKTSLSAVLSYCTRYSVQCFGSLNGKVKRCGAKSAAKAREPVSR